MSSVPMHHLIMGDDEFEIVDEKARSNINDIIEILIDAELITLTYPDLLARTISGAYENTKAVTVGNYAFSQCTSLTSVYFPLVTSIGEYAFNSCTSLVTVDLPIVSSLAPSAFGTCSALTALILRKTDSICTVNGTSLSGTPIASGTGYIYVPSALLSTYQSASIWSTYSAQFRALESYTVDGTVTGALDPSKI